MEYWLIGFTTSGFLGRMGFNQLFWTGPLESWHKVLYAAFIVSILMSRNTLKNTTKAILLIGGFLYAQQFHVPFLTHIENIQSGQKPIRSWSKGEILFLSAGPREFTLFNSSRTRSGQRPFFCLNSEGLWRNGFNCMVSSVASADKKPPILQLREQLIDQLKVEYGPKSQWMNSIVLGEKKGLSSKTREEFRKTGVFHLLVVSGLHAALLGAIFKLMILGPLQLFYFFRLIGPGIFYNLSLLLRLGLCLLLGFYAVFSGFGIATQRVALLYISQDVLRWVMPNLNFKMRLMMGLFLQTLLLPDGFLCDASFLSWGSYVLVIAAHKYRGSGMISWLWRLTSLQCVLCALVTAVTGQCSLMGIFINPPVIMIFSLTLWLAFIQIILFYSGLAFAFFDSLAEQVHLSFFSFLILAETKVGEIFQAVNIPVYLEFSRELFLREVLVGVVFLIFLRIFSTLPIEVKS